MEPSLSTFEKLWAKNPTSILFARLADAYRDQGDLDRAVEVCRRGLRYRPSYATGHMILGRCLLETGSIEEARQEFEKVLRLDPDHVAALEQLGRIERDSGLFEGALRRFRAAHAADPFSTELSKAVDELERLCRPVAEDGPDLEDDGEEDGGGLDLDSDVRTTVESADAPEFASTRFASLAFPPRADFDGVELSPVSAAPTGSEQAASPGSGNGPDDDGGSADIPGPGASPRLDGVEGRRVVTLTLADLYVTQGFVNKALEVLETLVASYPKDDRYRRRLQEIRDMDV